MHQFTSSPLTTSTVAIAVREKSMEQMQKGEKEQKFEGTEWDVFRAGVVDIEDKVVTNLKNYAPKLTVSPVD